jgi:hypothetical protein
MVLHVSLRVPLAVVQLALRRVSAPVFEALKDGWFLWAQHACMRGSVFTVPSMLLCVLPGLPDLPVVVLDTFPRLVDLDTFAFAVSGFWHLGMKSPIHDLAPPIKS